MHSQIILYKRGVLYQYRLTAKTRKNKRTSFLNTFYLFVLIIYDILTFSLAASFVAESIQSAELRLLIKASRIRVVISCT